MLCWHNLFSNAAKRSMNTPKITGFKKHSCVWITLAFFLFSITLHWIFGWKTFVQEQLEHNQQSRNQHLMFHLIILK